MFHLTYFEIQSWEYSDEKLSSAEVLFRRLLKEPAWTFVS